MDSKNIINRILQSTITSNNETRQVLILNLKASVTSLKYEITSTQGEYLTGNYHKYLNLEQVSHNQNNLIFDVTSNNSNIDRMYHIKLFEIEVVQSHLNLMSMIKIIDPVFQFFIFKTLQQSPMIDVNNQPHVQLTVDDNEPLEPVEPVKTSSLTVMASIA